MRSTALEAQQKSTFSAKEKHVQKSLETQFSVLCPFLRFSSENLSYKNMVQNFWNYEVFEAWLKKTN